MQIMKDMFVVTNWKYQYQANVFTWARKCNVKRIVQQKQIRCLLPNVCVNIRALQNVSVPRPRVSRFMCFQRHFLRYGKNSMSLLSIRDSENNIRLSECHMLSKIRETTPDSALWVLEYKAGHSYTLKHLEHWTAECSQSHARRHGFSNGNLCH